MKYPMFIYGTLMYGGSNHDYISDSLYSGETITTDAEYDMIDMIAYPAVVYGPSYIKGELYIASEKTLSLLDHLEQNGKFYKRLLVDVIDFPTKVWMYMLMDDILDTSTFPTIQSINNISDWRNAK